MTWIKTIGIKEATGKLKKIYDRVKGPNDNIDNILLSHSLRPHTLEGHMTLYKYVLHHPRNTLPKWLLEVIGVYVSMLNNCNYCVEHHYAGLTRLLDDQKAAQVIRSALETGNISQADTYLSKSDIAALHYAKLLTVNPSKLIASDIEMLRMVGLDDGEILEINQVAAYFSYANRTVLGLGVNTEGDIIGLSPGDSSNPDNWGHS